MGRSFALALKGLPGAMLASAAALGGSAADAQGLMYMRELRGAVTSDYVFRGVQKSEETFKIVGELSINGLHGGAMLLQPLEPDDFASEARLFGGWSPHLEDHGSPLDFELGFTWYATPDEAPGFPDESRFEPYAKLFIDAPLQPSISSYYDTELETFSLEGRLTHFVQLSGLNGLEFGLDGGLVSPEDADEHAYAQGSVDFVRNFLGGFEGFVGVRAATSSEDTFFSDTSPLGPIYDQQSNVWATAGFSASF